MESTTLVETLGDLRAAEVLARHDRLARDLLTRHDGTEIDKTDGFLLLFQRPIQAVTYALEYHRGLDGFAREEGLELAARVGIHLGEVIVHENPPADVARGAKPVEVEGLAKPMAARLMSLARGGQTLLTRGAFDLARRAAVGAESFGAETEWLAHGDYMIKGIDESTAIFEVGIAGRAPLEPPPDSEKVKRADRSDTILGWRPAAGKGIERRPNWVLDERVGQGGFGEVWLAQHVKTSERRVFKFCFDAERLRALQREITVFRLLKEELGDRDDIARILEWNFDEAPYFIESDYTEGGSLIDWAERNGGLSEVPLELRLQIVAQVGEALAAAHSVGVLHRDVKPGNILIHTRADGTVQARLCDFGMGVLTDEERLQSAGITVLGMTRSASETRTTSGTMLYHAPELFEGKTATVQADIYALGVVLYQLAVEDLYRALGPGWERTVEDELLRADIAAAVDLDPARRLSSPADLAARLWSLEERRVDLEARRQADEERERQTQALQRSKRRQRIAAVALVLVTVFAGAMVIQTRRVAVQAERANQEARRANDEAESARQVADFLTKLIRGADPLRAAAPDLELRELLDQAASSVRLDLAGQPAVRTQMMVVLGTTYRHLGLFEPAEALLGEALQAAGTTGRKDLQVKSRLELAILHNRRSEPSKALELLGEARTVARDLDDGSGVLSASVLAAMGVSHSITASYELGEGLLLEAIGIYEESTDAGGEDHIEAIRELASLYASWGRYESSERMTERAVDLTEAHYGSDHLQFGQALHESATLYVRRGEYASALPLVERAERILSPLLDPQHSYLLGLHRTLAVLYDMTGQPESAEATYERLLELALTDHDADDPSPGFVLYNYALMRIRQERWQDAESLLRRSLEILERASGPEHRDVGVPLYGLGRALIEMKRYSEAEPVLTRALAVSTSLDPHHSRLGGLYMLRGRLYQGLGQVELADLSFDKSFEIFSAHEASPFRTEEMERVLVQWTRLHREAGNEARARQLEAQMLGLARPTDVARETSRPQ